MDRITIMNDGKESSSTVGDAAEIDTGEMETGRIGGHAETIYNREEMGVITEVMGICTTSQPPQYRQQCRQNTNRDGGRSA